MTEAVIIDIETSPLMCSANQWTGFYMTTASFSHTTGPEDIKLLHPQRH